MGWYYTTGATHKDIIREIIEAHERPNGYFKTIRHCCVGNTLWTVHASKAHDEISHWIGCYPLTRGTGDGWGYKPMDESMGPYYYSCPLAYLALTPATNEQWRAGVASYWERRREKRTRRSTLQILDQSAGPRLFKTPADVDTFIHKERASWGR